MKNWSEYRKLYLSYACILLIPLVMAVFFYFYSYQVVQRQADASNINLIHTIRESCDRELQYYENVLVQLALDKSIQELSTVRGDFKGEEYYQLYSLHTKIADLRMAINQSGDYCDDITVYFKNNGKLVSSNGCMDLDLYCDLYCFEDEESIRWLENYLSEYHVWEVARAKEKLKNGSLPLLLTMTNVKGDFGETTAMIGLWIDIDSLTGSMELEHGENGMDWLVINEKDQIMSRSEEFGNIGLIYEELEEGNDGQLEFEGNKYILRSLPSEVFDWKYVLLMPERSIGSSVRRLRNFFAISVLFCLCIGFIAARQMTKKSYDPIKALLDMFRNYDKENRQVENEYVYLREKAMTLFEEHSEFRQRLHQSLEVVRQYYLIDILIDPFGEQENNTPERMEICRKFEQGHNLVLLLKIRRKTGESSGEEQENDTETNNLQKFIVGNVFGEGLSEVFDVEMAELGDVMAVLMNIRQMMPGFEEELLETLDRLQKFIFDNFGFRVAVLAGELHEGIGGIHLSYREAREAESFLPLLDPDYINYHEIQNTSNQNYKYSMSQEERIITAIRNNDSQLAVSCINGVLDMNFKQLKTSPVTRRFLLYDLAGTLIKAAQEVEGALGEEIDLQTISVKMSYQEIQDWFKSAVEKMCHPVEEESGNDSGSQLCEEINKYIRENFGNVELNVSQIGQHFHMTPAYLSSLYKKNTGESLLRVLNQVRIDAAEKLLAAGASVLETAEQTGFRDSSTFIRAFKKATGTTPGQLKNSKRS